MGAMEACQEGAVAGKMGQIVASVTEASASEASATDATKSPLRECGQVLARLWRCDQNANF